MTTTEERGSPTAGQRAAKAGAKHLGRRIGWILGAKIGFWVAVALVLLLLVMAAGAQVADQNTTTTAGGTGAGPGGMEWDAGNIISDAVFYNSQALPDEAAVQAALDEVGGSCTDPTCLRLDSYRTFPATSKWCAPYPVPQNGNPERYAVILLKLAQVCGVNPQVAIVMIQKESQGLTRSSPPAALTGFGCPDTGPGGSANCDAASSGVWAQTLGMFTSFAKLHQDASSVNYPEGKTSDILWNVKESGCGSAPVTVANRATATLYTYTPYQPNAAALAAYPGTGDACSAYGNRNFFRLFQQFFGPTGGGKPAAADGTTTGGGSTWTGVMNNSQDPASYGWAIGGPTVPLVFQGHNFGQVAAGTQGLWVGMLTELVPLIPGGLDDNLGCLDVRRNVNNPSAWSLHAYALACDLNSDVNCNGCSAASLQGRPFALPMITHVIAAKYCMQWGGDFGTPDPMHVEIHCSPQQITQGP